MLTLSQKQTLQQKLSPQQIQYQKLLQLNTLALEQRIKNELEINPILEENATEEIENTQETEKEKEQTPEEEEFENYSQEEFSIEDFMNDRDFEGDKLNRSNEEVYQPVAPARESLSEHLVEQLQMLNLREDLYVLGEEIIGSLDNDGYLKRNLPDIINEMKTFEHIDITMEEGEELLKKIQTFDPPGIASRNLQECLLVQLRNSKFDAYYKFLAEEL
ncbi:MAG TPA: hypothetical protein VLM39_05040, partial [Ignavibacteriaceae bacterium]|nr:hypothetical protein [Ignavibacteriaceae bacterium]